MKKTQRAIELAKACGAVPMFKDGIAAFTEDQLQQFYLAAAADGKHDVVDSTARRSVDPRVDELAQLVRRLATVVEVRCPGHSITRSALEYLRANGFSSGTLLKSTHAKSAA